jgi:hypothetical protein
MRFEKGDVQTSVWEGVWTPGTPWCDFISSHTLLASGTTRFVLTDNDLYTFLYDTNKNTNAFGFQRHGKLTNDNGETLIFSGHFRGVWDGVIYESLKTSIRIILN